MIWTYNSLKGESRKWARENRIPVGERCIPVKGRRKMGKSAIDRVAGNGVHGFSMRRNKGDGETTKMVRGLDNQWKPGRGTIVRHRKNICQMATNETIKTMQMDDHDKRKALAKEVIVRQERLAREKTIKRELRKRNRNPKARRGYNRRKAA